MEGERYTISVISDPQIDLNQVRAGARPVEWELLRECFEHMDVQTVAVCGDITENALADEWDCFFDVFRRYCRARELFIVPGNMDRPDQAPGRRTFLDAYARFLGQPMDRPYFALETQCCSLMGICPEQDGETSISDAQLASLDGCVQRAAERGVPALIFSHYQLSDTIDVDWEYASLGAESTRVRAILERHGSKVVFFSGHIHRGLIARPGGSVVSQRNVTYVSAPSLCKPDTIHYQADNVDAGTGYMLEIEGETVRIRGFDFLQGQALESFDWTI